VTLDSFDEAMARARVRAAVLGQAAQELAAVHGRARSPAGDAEAVVDGAGALLSLWLADSVVRLAPGAVGALIVDTARTAADDAARARRAVLDDLTRSLDR